MDKREDPPRSAAEDDEIPSRVEEALAEYFILVDSGRAPSREEFLSRHPDIAADLELFLSDEEAFRVRLSGTLRSETPTQLLQTVPVVLPLVTPVTLGDYEILEMLGRGGMGVVYKARQRSLPRVVALKMILSGRLALPEDVERFRREAREAAALDHPNIVPIYEIGEVEDQHYFTMKYLGGGDLRSRLSHLMKDHRAAAALVERIARILDHAHQRHVLHRDVKPSNILFDDNEEPYLADFGLARRLDARQGITANGAIWGTPQYMAPEQLAPDKGALSPSTDVYSLGIILYELLVGHVPFEADGGVASFRRILEDDPVPPRKIATGVSRDLETICLKCIEKRPQDRYRTAFALAADLRRYLSHEPIDARPCGSLARAMKWSRRRPAAAGVLAVIILAVLGLLGLSIGYNRSIRDEFAAREALSAHYLYAARANLAYEAWQDGRYAVVRDILQQLRPPDGAEDLRGFEWHWLDSALRQQERSIPVQLGTHDLRPVVAVGQDADGVLLATGDQDLTVRLWRLETGAAAGSLRFGGWPSRVEFDPDCRRLAITDGYTVTLFDLGTKAALWGHGLESGVIIRDLTFSPDGASLLLGRTGGSSISLDSATGAPRRSYRWGCKRAIYSLDGQEIFTLGATGSAEDGVQVFQATSGDGLRWIGVRGGTLHDVALSPRGDVLATAGKDRAVRFLDPARGTDLAPPLLLGGEVLDVAFSPDGESILAGTAEGDVRFWNYRQGRTVRTLPGHASAVGRVLFAGSRHAITAGHDFLARVWDLGLPQEPASLEGFSHIVWEGAISRDGRIISAATQDFVLHLWRLKDQGIEEIGRLAIPQEHSFVAGCLSRDGDRAAAGAADGHIEVLRVAWDGEAPRLQSEGLLEGHEARVFGCGFSDDSALLASSDSRYRMILWERRGGLGAPSWAEVARVQTPFPARDFAFSPDRRFLAMSISFHDVVMICDLRDPTRIEIISGQSRVSSLSFSPDSRILAAGRIDGTIDLWEVRRSGQRFEVVRRGAIEKHGGPVGGLIFHPGGRALLSGGQDRTLKIWDLMESPEGLIGILRAGVGGFEGGIEVLCFSPDGGLLLAAGGSFGARFGEAKLFRATGSLPSVPRP